jgi:hypothetical protein
MYFLFESSIKAKGEKSEIESCFKNLTGKMQEKIKFIISD